MQFQHDYDGTSHSFRQETHTSGTISSVDCPPYGSTPTIGFHHGQLWAGTPSHFLKQLYDDFDYREDDTWLISYPRSGTSWTYALLCAVLHGGDIEALQKDQSENRILKFLPIEVGSAASVTERIRSWKALPSPRVIPTHLPYRLFPETVQEQCGKVVYVMRNPKDVAVSFYHFHRSHRLLGFYKGTWDEFFECFISGRVIYGSLFDHVSGWLPHVRQNNGNMLLLSYEQMQEDLPTQIRRTGAFLRTALSPQAVAAIAAHCSFQSMSANPFSNREGDSIMDSSIARFLRKGIVGDWRNYFTKAQEERFDAQWRGMNTSPHGPRDD
jgi:hypothetical protein